MGATDIIDELEKYTQLELEDEIERRFKLKQIKLLGKLNEI